MGFPKPLLRIGDETFLDRGLHSMLKVVRTVIVVTGAHAERVSPEIPTGTRVRVAHNPHFVLGQLSSLKCGIRAVAPDAAGAIVHLADHPVVRLSTFHALADKFTVVQSPILVVRFDGRRGHPVLFSKAVFEELLEAPDSEGARYVVNADPSRVVYVDLDDPGVTLDLDTPEDLMRAGLAPPPEGGIGGDR
jgi:molybdenum cofactor cytidylyltransferase